MCAMLPKGKVIKLIESSIDHVRYGWESGFEEYSKDLRFDFIIYDKPMFRKYQLRNAYFEGFTRAIQLIRHEFVNELGVSERDRRIGIARQALNDLSYDERISLLKQSIKTKD